MMKPKIAHGARRRANIKRVARRHQNHTQTSEFIRSSQE